MQIHGGSRLPDPQRPFDGVDPSQGIETGDRR
jgi:hypothetical protein